MRKFTLRLRAKSMLALVAAFILALVPTVLIGWEMLEQGRAHFGEAYAKNFTLLNAQRIKAPVTRDLALAKRFAGSVLLRQWFSDEASAEQKRLFFREAKGFRGAFQDRNYFVVSRKSRAYYLNNREKPYSQSPRYYLDPKTPMMPGFLKQLIRKHNT